MNKPLVSRRDLCRIGLIILIALTLVFLFVQSLLPPDISRAESEGVADAVGTVVSPDTGFGAFLAAHIRDIAHFTEYGVLGTEIALYIFFFTADKKRLAALSPLGALAIGFLDETLQIFSGRVADVVDVWLDLSGFVFFSAVTYLLIFAIGKIRKKAAADTPSVEAAPEYQRTE